MVRSDRLALTYPMLPANRACCLASLGGCLTACVYRCKALLRDMLQAFVSRLLSRCFFVFRVPSGLEGHWLREGDSSKEADASLPLNNSSGRYDGDDDAA